MKQTFINPTYLYYMISESDMLTDLTDHLDKLNIIYTLEKASPHLNRICLHTPCVIKTFEIQHNAHWYLPSLTINGLYATQMTIWCSDTILDVSDFDRSINEYDILINDYAISHSAIVVDNEPRIAVPHETKIKQLIIV